MSASTKSEEASTTKVASRVGAVCQPHVVPPLLSLSEADSFLPSGSRLWQRTACSVGDGVFRDCRRYDDNACTAASSWTSRYSEARRDVWRASCETASVSKPTIVDVVYTEGRRAGARLSRNDMSFSHRAGRFPENGRSIAIASRIASAVDHRASIDLRGSAMLNQRFTLSRGLLYSTQADLSHPAVLTGSLSTDMTSVISADRMLRSAIEADFRILPKPSLENHSCV